MRRRFQLVAVLGLAIGLVVVFLVWREPQETDYLSPSSTSSLAAPGAIRHPIFSSPLHAATDTPFHSPLAVVPTAPSRVTSATIEAIRDTRPTATHPASEGLDLPYVSPTTWRVWSLRILALAGVLAYIGLRLRKGQ
jgi:hypothetical protein